MRKIIKVSTDNEVTFHEWHEEADLCSLIGEQCSYCERVFPRRLYEVLGCKRNVVMLVDEDGLQHGCEMNAVGSWLYQTDVHGDPILGNILFVEDADEGHRGFTERTTLQLFTKLAELAEAAKG